MIHLVTFATPEFTRSLARCVTSGFQHGIHQTHACDSGVLPPDMQERCAGRRGFGWWQWKPQVIEIAMRGCSDDDVLIYADVGVEFINNVSHIIERMDQDIFLFGNNWEHAHWCKRDVIEAIMPGTPWQAFGKQCQASVMFFRVSDYTRKFVKEWLDWCLTRKGHARPGPCNECDHAVGAVGYLIDDSVSLTMNHPEFQEHRHDQAILTTMAYREGIKLHWWPAIYNGGQFTYEKLPEYAGDTYPAIFHHHRRRNNEWSNAA